MRVFVLCTGRSGSTSFIRACRHIENYTALHESSAGKYGEEKLLFPDNHIEADNHLIWFMGELEHKYSTSNTLYCYLTRDLEAIAQSYNERWNRFSRAVSVRSFAYGLLQREKRWRHDQRLSVCRYFADTMDKNIRYFLSRQESTIEMPLEDIVAHFPTFWDRIGAKGDIQESLKEFKTRHNARPKRGKILCGLRYLYGRTL